MLGDHGSHKYFNKEVVWKITLNVRIADAVHIAAKVASARRARNVVVQIVAMTQPNENDVIEEIPDYLNTI